MLAPSLLRALITRQATSRPTLPACQPPTDRHASVMLACSSGSNSACTWVGNSSVSTPWAAWLMATRLLMLFHSSAERLVSQGWVK